jgi:hypothetical protein
MPDMQTFPHRALNLEKEWLNPSEFLEHLLHKRYLSHTTETKVIVLYVSVNSRVMSKLNTDFSTQRTNICTSWDFIFCVTQVHFILAMTVSDKLEKISTEALCVFHMRQNTFFQTIFIVFSPHQIHQHA